MNFSDRELAANFLTEFSSDEHVHKLFEWATNNPHECLTYLDYHRLQLEAWLWSFKDQYIGKRVLDIGVYLKRDYFGSDYVTMGDLPMNDIQADITNFDTEVVGKDWDLIICTEVLEHCTDPFLGVRKLAEILAPDGLFLVTSPFIWPWHGTNEYNDYWRFTHQGWEILLAQAGFSKLNIIRCEFTQEGKEAYNNLRRWESMGLANQTEASTGYLVEARK